MTLSRIIAFNTLAQGVGKVISLVAGVVLTSILTRKLGVEDYGGYVFIFTVVLFANALADWGSTFIATREAARPNARQAQIFGNTFILKVLSGIFVSLVLILLSQYWDLLKGYARELTVAGLLIPFLATKSAFQVIFQSRLQLWKLSVMDTSSSLFFLVAILLLPSHQIDLRFVFGYLVLSVLLALAIAKLFLVRDIKISLKPNRHYLKLLVQESAAMGLLLTVFSMYNRLDIVLLERFQGQEAVGLYGLSYKIYENLIVGAAFFSNSVFPILSARAGNKANFRRTFQKAISWLLVAGLGVSLITVIAAGLVIKIISGPEFSAAIVPLQILAFSIVVAYLNHATGYSLIALNHQLTSMKIAGLALGLNLGLNWIFIPRYSYIASAVITLVTELFVFALSLRVLTRLTGRLNWRQMLSDLRPRRLWEKLAN